jgi:glycosyltransferase involved in cell wall biosynthesis
MISTGFVPVRKCLPTVLHVFSLQHLDQSNNLGTTRSFYRRWMMRYSWPKADLVITNSRFAAEQILGVFPQWKDRLLQFYEGLQHEQFNATAAPGEVGRLKDSLGLEPGYFLWLSNFYAYKQANRLVAGYGLLDAETRRRHPLVMVGADWEGHLPACKALAQAGGIATDVKFLGWVGDDLLAPLYRHALAHCLASREETFGRTVIESMACGTPVIVNDIPIMHEVTEGHAEIVDFNEVSQVARALKRMAEDPALRARLREGGMVRAQRFSFEKFTSERIDAIERLVSARRSG